MRILLTILWLFLSLPALAAEPDVRIQSRLVPADGVSVGGTLRLEVDLLVDTWFTAAPVLPPLSLTGAVVAPPSSEASHLTLQLDGKTFFGMRFTYRITPQLAQRFEIPALSFQLQPGQASGPVTLSSPAFSFDAKALPHGDKAPQLVANAVRFTQEIQRSHQPLRVGDSVTRRLRIEADGAQAILLPVPDFAAVDGLKRYVQTPTVKALDDGRGTTTGGMREDVTTYVVEQTGQYRLPAIQLTWWDANSGQSQLVKVPDIELTAQASSYQAPFSISEDLHALGQQARITLAGHWLMLTSAAALVILLVWLVRTRLHGLWRRALQWREARRQTWLNSPGYALRLARAQLRRRPMELGGLYLWVRRRTGRLAISPLFQGSTESVTQPVLAFFRLIYGANKQPQGQDAASQIVAALDGAMAKPHGQTGQPHGLQPLNPGQNEPTPFHQTRKP
ncbi:MAG: hypothetical protein RR761_10230 [Aeromonas sp.]|uniref:hypothetical protein n=1 Tax=Aeromonas sp. TaxID=647 RepID=UPI002FC88C5B